MKYFSRSQGRALSFFGIIVGRGRVDAAAEGGVED